MLGHGGDSKVPGGVDEDERAPVGRGGRFAGEVQQGYVAVLLDGVGAVAMRDDEDRFVCDVALGDGPDRCGFAERGQCRVENKVRLPIEPHR